MKMIIGGCNTCKWWVNSLSKPEFGECRLTEWDDVDSHTYPKSLAKAYAGGHEPGSAVLVTHGEFGCTQHESV